ncbi:MAG: hypothetical protein R3E68_03495 [Burkholderiaceae bacterium]
MQQRFKWVLVIVVACIVLVLAALADQARLIPVETASKARVACLSYAPYRLAGETPFDPTHRVSAQRIEADLLLLRKLTNCVRTYAVDQGLDQLPAIAEKLGMQVLLGIWIGRDVRNNDRQIELAIRTARAHPSSIRTVIVGNEVLLRQEQSPEQLAAYLDTVRNALDIPVTYADVWEFWMKNDTLSRHVDLVTVHILPYWEDEPVGIAAAVDHVVDIHHEVARHFAPLEVRIGETGWPSQGRMRGPARPGLVEQATFVRQWMNAADREKIDYNLIEGFDQPWKRRLEGAMGAGWGVFDSDGLAKFAFDGPVAARADGLAPSVIAGLAGLLLAGLLYAVFLRLNASAAQRSDGGFRLVGLTGLLIGLLLPWQWHVLSAWNRFWPEWLAAGTFTLLGNLMLLMVVWRVGQQIDQAQRAPSPIPGRIIGLLVHALLFGTALFMILHAFDDRYRGFPVPLYVAPAVGFLLARLSGPWLPVQTSASRLLALVVAACLPWLVWQAGHENLQALGFLSLPAAMAALSLWPARARMPSNQPAAAGSTE